MSCRKETISDELSFVCPFQVSGIGFCEELETVAECFFPPAFQFVAMFVS